MASARTRESTRPWRRPSAHRPPSQISNVATIASKAADMIEMRIGLESGCPRLRDHRDPERLRPDRICWSRPSNGGGFFRLALERAPLLVPGTAALVCNPSVSTTGLEGPQRVESMHCAGDAPRTCLGHSRGRAVVRVRLAPTSSAHRRLRSRGSGPCSQFSNVRTDTRHNAPSINALKIKGPLIGI